MNQKQLFCDNYNVYGDMHPLHLLFIVMLLFVEMCFEIYIISHIYFCVGFTAFTLLALLTANQFHQPTNCFKFLVDMQRLFV